MTASLLRAAGAAAQQGARRHRTDPYDPSSEAGYAFDLFARPANVTVVDDSGTARVSAWAELVSAGAYSQGTMASRPLWLPSEATLNNRAAVQFSAHSLDASIGITAADHTFYFFGTMDAASAALRVLLGFITSPSSGRLYLYQTESAGNVGYFDGGGVQAFGAAATGAQALTWVLDRGGTAEGFRGNSSIGTDTCANFLASDASRLGQNPTVGGQSAAAKVGRLIGFTGLHDGTTQGRVRAWGASYYGISL